MIIHAEKVHPYYIKRRTVESGLQYEDSPTQWWLLLVTAATSLLLGTMIYGGYLLFETRHELVLERFDSAYRLSEQELQLSQVAEILKYVLKRDESKPSEVTKKIEVTDLEDPKVIPAVSNNIVLVKAPKANLRTEARMGAPVLMVVAQASKLVTEGEDGDWYRVTTPNGEKAWVSKKIVRVEAAQG